MRMDEHPEMKINRERESWSFRCQNQKCRERFELDIPTNTRFDLVWTCPVCDTTNRRSLMGRGTTP